MVLDRFIASRVRHADPQVRIAALAKLESTDPLLAECALSDADPAVRLAALGRICDVDVLDRAARVDPDPPCRELAAARLQDLLRGPEGNELPLAPRIEFLASRCAPELAAFLAEHALSSGVRAAALTHVSDEAILTRIACHDGSAELRRAALERVHSLEALQVIEQTTRTSDQGVSRTARQRLQAARDVDQRRAVAEAMCQRMEALAAGDANAIDEAAFHHLEREWDATRAPTDDEDLVRRHAAARDRFRHLLSERAHARQTRRPLLAEREALLAELRSATEIDEALVARIDERIADTRRAWAEIPDAEAGDAQRFASLATDIEAQRRRLERMRADAQPLRSLIADIRARVDADAPIGRVRLAELERMAIEAPRPEDSFLVHALDHDLGEAMERLRQKHRREQARASEDITQIDGLVAEMEGALERGELGTALNRHDDAHRGLLTLDPRTRAVRSLRERLERAAPQLKELRDWQRWGVEQTRTSMCLEVETLVGSAEPPEQLARRIRAFRKDWQQLDRASGTTSKSMWERFDRACTQAYAPCAAYFAEQRTARAANLERKQSLIERLEVLDRDTDWSTADWRGAERAFHASEREWQGVGPVDRALAKDLIERHAAVRKRLDERFDARRAGEVERRRALITELNALLASEDLADAPARVRAAQAQWTPTVSARRSVEQALWQEFRAACDAIYSRLNARRNAAAEEQRAAADAAAALCERAEALARDLAGASTHDADALTATLEQGRAQLQSLRREFGQAPRAKPGAEAQVGQRFKSACASVERALASQREALARIALQNDAERARLCRELERQVLGASDDDAIAVVDRARSAWADLPAGAGAARDALEKRFELACAAARSAQERERLARNLAVQAEEKRRLCLRLEIVAGVPSPQAEGSARLSYQAQWMQDSLRGTSRWPASEREKLEEARRIEARWLELGVATVAEEDDLETRYRAAMSALHGTMSARNSR